MSNVISTKVIELNGETFTIVRTDAETVFVHRGTEISDATRLHYMSPVRRAVLAANS
jgi:hypothetical protein